MKKAVSARCCTVGGLLFILVMTSLCAGKGLSQAAPEASYMVATAAAGAQSPEKLKKVNEALAQGALAYQAGSFETAQQWYEAALQVDAQNAPARKGLEATRQMVAAKRQALSQLPKDPAEREQFLATLYKQANQYYKSKQYKAAHGAFEQIWLTAGDYKGKTLKMMEKSGLKLGAEAPSAEAPSAEQPPVQLVDMKVAAPAAESASPAPQVAQAAAPKADDATVVAETPGEPVTVVVKDDQELNTAAATPAAKPADAPKAEPLPEVAAAQASSSVDEVTQIEVSRLLKGAETQLSAGKPEEARKNVTKALELWPENQQAKALLKQLNKQAGYSRRDATDTYLSEANALFRDKKYDEAIERYREVLKVDPNNELAVGGIAKAECEAAKLGKVVATKTRLEQGHELDVLQQQAIKAYDKGDLRRARELWQQILKQDPKNKLAQTYLEETQEAFARLEADEGKRVQAEKRSEAAEKLLSAPITISTDRKIPLSEFMYSLSFATPIELEYYIAEGANAMIFANFVDKPLREVLDTVLLPIGLAWSIDEKNVITVEPKFVSKVYNLSPAQMGKVKSLMDSGQLQKLVWGQAEPPAEGVSLTVDERQNILVVTGSQMHIKKVESLLPTLQVAQEQEMTVKIYKIKKEDGPRIKSLINSIISASSNTPFDLERKIFIDGEDLIVRDTPENITKIEELLLDKQFISNLRGEKIDIANFSLVPRDVENVKSDQIQAFTARVVEAIKVFLYSQEGESQANKEGRRLWYDPATMQLTVVDMPTNIARVAEYIDSLPELGQKSRQEVKFLKYAVAEDLASSLERILDLTSASATGGAGGGGEIVMKLRRGEERQFRDLRLRVQRVEQTDPEDRKSGSVELSINTGTQVSTLTLRELDTQFVENYEMTAEDVVANTGQSGEGSARIRVRYVPNAMGGGGGEQLALQLLEQQQQKTPEEQGITINPFGELNAIILRYTNPAMYKEATQLIAQLDQPTNQVSIETKFVEVNETRAKEFSADFNIAGLGQGRDVDWSTQNINTRFAQDVDEYRDAFSPPIENPVNANLIKGTTVLSAVIGNFPSIQYSLRLLEAEGIVNIVNGPKVTALDGQEAEFRIEQYSPETTQQNDNPLVDIINPLDQAFQDLQLADVDEADNQRIITAVVLRVTPEITSKDSIILNDLSAELIDFEGWLGESLQPVVQDVADRTQNQFFTPVTPPFAISNQNMQMLVKRKKIVTDARINNGGTIVLGGWTGERSEELTSGIPVLRNMPYFGKLLFSRNQRSSDRTTLMIFLTGYLVD